jgi:hypothetical protein
MRHYLTENAALRMARTPAAALVAIAGGPHVQPPLLLRARSVAVNVPDIALAANAHRYPAAPAVVSPERPLSHRNAIPLQGLDNAVRRVHKRAVELPLARTAPKARGLTAKSCPGPSPLRRQALRITKMRGVASIAMPVRAVLRPPDRDGGGLGRLRPQLALIVPLAQRHTLHPQDVVGGDGVEMEIRQREGEEEVLRREG